MVHQKANLFCFVFHGKYGCHLLKCYDSIDWLAQNFFLYNSDQTELGLSLENFCIAPINAIMFVRSKRRSKKNEVKAIIGLWIKWGQLCIFHQKKKTTFTTL